jgi:hypothetical protein
VVETEKYRVVESIPLYKITEDAQAKNALGKDDILLGYCITQSVSLKSHKKYTDFFSLPSCRRELRYHFGGPGPDEEMIFPHCAVTI